MVSGGLIVFIASFIESKRAIVLLLCFVTTAIFLVELARFTWRRFNALVVRFLGAVIRAGEEKHFTSSFHYCLGATLSAAVFPRAIAFLAILYLAFGDPIASIAGIKFGGNLWKPNPLNVGKSLEGSLACFLFCGILTFFLSYFLQMTEGLPPQDRIWFSLLGGLGATLGELVPLKTDDNLAMPLISGAFLWLTSTVLNLIPGLYLS
jgi:dolichol kinase